MEAGREDGWERRSAKSEKYRRAERKEGRGKGRMPISRHPLRRTFAALSSPPVLLRLHRTAAAPNPRARTTASPCESPYPPPKNVNFSYQEKGRCMQCVARGRMRAYLEGLL
jgi:hypothetical protein